MPGFNTARPTHGLIGSVFADDGLIASNFLSSISQFLDQEDGWVLHSENSFSWYPHRLAVHVVVKADSFEKGRIYAEMQIDLVENVKEYSEETLKFMNQMNAQSAGWVVWANHELNLISLSTRIPIRREEWWWVSLLSHVIPLASTVAESNADELAELSGGNPAIRNHPDKGSREVSDSWLAGVRRGPREFTASLSLMITGLDLSSLQNALEQLMPDSSIGIWDPFKVCVMDANELTYCMLREHWQSERGLGWQFSSIDSDLDNRKMVEGGASLEELALAATRNMDLMLDDSWMPILGGWVAASDFGLVRQWFLDAFLIEVVCEGSKLTFGNVGALMLNSFETAYGRSKDVEQISDEDFNHNEYFERTMVNLNLKNGRLNRSSYFPGALDRNDKEQIWLAPRQSLVCSFGIFNPAGPTVSSLEFGFDGEKWSLYDVLRHPFGEQVVILGVAPLGNEHDFFSQLIEDVLAETDQGVLGSGPHWVDIRMEGFADSINRGIERFALSSQGRDLEDDCQLILNQQGDPWYGISGSEALEHEYEIGEPVETWIGLVKRPNVIFGHRAFMRSAWEGAKEYVQTTDPAKAQGLANSLIGVARDRILGDFQFRNSEGSLIQNPFSEN